MGWFDGLFGRACKVGTPGETARVIGQQYLTLKKRNPQATDQEVFSTIIQARHIAQPYTPQQLSELKSAVQVDSVTEFVMSLVVIESNFDPQELPGGSFVMLGVTIMNELSALGIEEA